MSGLAAVVVCISTAAIAAPPPTDVDSVTVVADMDVRLSVAIGGDVAEDTFVSSAPAGLLCGGAQYQYMTRSNRQCWLRARRKSQVLLTAQANGRYGTDWSVQWVGCEPIANGAACVINIQDEGQVAALFTRR